MSADGIAMAWRAGATLVNMEMQWWHTNDIADPPCWQRMQVYPNPMLGSEKSARMVNSAGEEFFNQQQDDPLALWSLHRAAQGAGQTSACRAKRAMMAATYAGFDHCDAAEVEAYTTYGKTFRQLGLNFPNNWSKPPSPRIIGKAAIDVDTATMRSSVPGLYVAGGVGGHSNGLIGLATYDGKVVADGIVADFAGLDSEPVSAERDRMRKPAARPTCATRRAARISPGQN